MSDFDTPEHAALREHCRAHGHRTINEREHTGAAHGCGLVCLHCGKFWHGEDAPQELEPHKTESVDVERRR